MGIQLLKKTYIGDFIEGCICSQTEVGAGDIVTDGTGDNNDGDTERFKLLPGLGHLQGTVVGLKRHHGDRVIMCKTKLTSLTSHQEDRLYTATKLKLTSLKCHYGDRVFTATKD